MWCTCGAQLHTSATGPLLLPLGTGTAGIVIERHARSHGSQCTVRGERQVSRHTCAIGPELRNNKYVRICVGGVGDARSTADRRGRRVSEPQESTLQGRSVNNRACRVTSQLLRCKMLQWPPGSVAKVSLRKLDELQLQN